MFVQNISLKTFFVSDINKNKVNTFCWRIMTNKPLHIYDSRYHSWTNLLDKISTNKQISMDFISGRKNFFLIRPRTF